jgi:hypothetical protein
MHAAPVFPRKSPIKYQPGEADKGNRVENTSRTGTPNKDTSNYKKEHVYTATADMTINTGETMSPTPRP